MALENLTPSNRMEAILDGRDIEPSNRKEYFMQKAVSAGGSSLPLIVTIDGEQYNESASAYLGTSSHSLQDIITAYNGGRQVFLRTMECYNGKPVFLPMTTIAGGNRGAIFTTTITESLNGTSLKIAYIQAFVAQTGDVQIPDPTFCSIEVTIT